MGVGKAWTLNGVEMDETVVKAVGETGLELDPEVRKVATGGLPYAQFASLVKRKPMATWKTLAIAQQIGQFDAGRLSTKISGLTAGLKLYAQQIEEGGHRVTGSNHRKYTVTKGIIVPKSLSCSDTGDAELSLEAQAVFDGTNAIVQISDASALPTAATDDERFGLGPCTVGGVAITQITKVDIQFGIELFVLHADGDADPTFAAVKVIDAKIEIGVSDIEALKSTNIPLDGKICTHANTAIYFRKRAAGGIWVADATEEHVKATAAGMAVAKQAFNSSGEEAGATIEVSTIFDGTNLPILFDTASALPE